MDTSCPDYDEFDAILNFKRSRLKYFGGRLGEHPLNVFPPLRQQRISARTVEKLLATSTTSACCRHHSTQPWVSQLLLSVASSASQHNALATPYKRSHCPGVSTVIKTNRWSNRQEIVCLSFGIFKSSSSSSSSSNDCVRLLLSCN
jgi:hypothetical protein